MKVRQLVVLCDGTNNNLTGGAADTHVVTLAELLRADPDTHRFVYYDPGVGNPGEIPGTTLWDKTRRQLERASGLAFGRGVYDNIAEGYRFLMRHWQGIEDQIWLFGFSRGAFTARSIGGLVNRFGILQPHMETMLPTLLHLYFSPVSDQTTSISEQASRLFADKAHPRPRVHFVGVWDTVATVGTWPFELRFHVAPDLAGKRFIHVRQALALDEHRAQFVPRAYAQDNGHFPTADGDQGSVIQLWFRGSHCDVGGGYALAVSDIARAPLTWLLSEAVGCGLRLHHGNQPLDDEERAAAAVSQTVARITHQPDPVVLGTARRNIHSELHQSPLWALTGMALRDTQRAAVDGAPGRITRMAEHTSVEAWAAEYPDDTVWRTWGFDVPFWVNLALVVLWMLVFGHLLQGAGPGVEGIWSTLAQAPQNIWDFLGQDLIFQSWQLNVFRGGGEWWRELGSFHAPRWALAWDLALIFSYAYVLCVVVARAFANVAGLNRLGRRVPTWLGVLGWALPVTVFADIAEDVVGWITITFGYNELWLAAFVGRAAMLLCSSAKIAGLLGVALLVLGQRFLALRNTTEVHP
jgi:uncharacterized protein (DUF2235 family)